MPSPAPAPDSELILDPDGSVYHLGLRPEHLAPLVITVGDPKRVAAVSRHFEAVDFRQNRREFVTHVGRFAERRIMCISTGIGTDNVDIVLNELDALANVDFESRLPRAQLRQLTFVRLGTSGTFQRDIEVDTLLAASHAVGLDGLGPFYDFAPSMEASVLRERYPEFAAAAYGAPCDGELQNAWASSHAGHRVGLTLTCAGFYGPQRRTLRLPFRGPSLAELADIRFDHGPTAAPGRFTNFEMETAGIYGLAGLLGHRSLSISAILANRATGDFSSRPAETVDRMIDSFFESVREQPGLWFGGLG